jgi:hypothetical protein
MSGDFRSVSCVERCEPALKRLRAFVDRPGRHERRLFDEIRKLVAVKLPIRLSRLAVCHPIAMIGSVPDGVAFSDVCDVVPFLEQIMRVESGSNVILRSVHKFVSPCVIRQFSRTPSSPYWMNVIGAYEFPPFSSLSMTRSFSPWGVEGSTCVYAVLKSFSEVFAVDECVFVPTGMVSTNVLPLFLIRYEIVD